ncbi:hypothetical protein HYH03_002514 [Edaphochlamys debaryana]|uniref:Uncharacterized protein n=1 Tax=Edaphochlamys debaryana TaxID=47281 RepID=A0A836C584_9CHLO|nr:hypothetical protein HYH03_002514 [Edaphochlamys debaryana]|eukprot:KAG2499569.1 hypothetical protein HYH03_002514 [Edaphochlamys debaryana]
MGRLMKPSLGPVSCGWYPLMDERSARPFVSRFKYLAHDNGRPERWRKWFTVGRAVGMRYNVMAVDTDVVAIGDWYERVKQPPLRSITMFSQAEGSFPINGGFSYIQNAAPDGPVAWLLYEAVHRAVRWSEDCSCLRNISAGAARDVDSGLRTDDQSMLTDSMLSALSGRPLFYQVMHHMANSHPDWGRLFPGGVQASAGPTDVGLTGALHVPGPQEFDEHILKASADLMVFSVSPALSPWVCDKWPCAEAPGTSTDFRLRTGLLRYPHLGASQEWPKEVAGANPFGPPGPLTVAYRTAHQEARRLAGTPLLLDPEDPAHEEAARAIPPETFALLSPPDTEAYGPPGTPREVLGAWLEAPWRDVGRWGHWHSHLKPSAQPAMGHLHSGFSPGMHDPKGVMLRLADLWDWDLAERIAGDRQHTFYATMALHDLDVAEWERREARELRRVLAYAPGVVHAGMSKDQFLRAAEQLALASVVLGAVAAWPAAPCDADWVLYPWARQLPRPIVHTVPWTHINTTDQVAPFGDSLDSLQCEWTGFISWGCLSTPAAPHDTGRGLLAVELRRLLTWLLPEQRHPRPDTAVALSKGRLPPPPAGSTRFKPVKAEELLHLNAAALLQAPLEPQLLWLDRLVELSGGKEVRPALDRYDRWRAACRALSYRGSNVSSSVLW